MPSAETNNVILNEVNQEIKTVYEYFLAAGLSHEEIVEKASPLLHPIKKDVLKKKCLSLINTTVFCMLVGAMLTSESIMRPAYKHGRGLLFELLPWWDWTSMYGSSCFIFNPYFENQQVWVADCEVCGDLYEINHLNMTSPEELFIYLQSDIPVIITDATSDWPAMDDSFTILNLTEGYLQTEDLAFGEVCMFQTNLKVQNHHKLLKKILSEDLVTGWFAHWENCQKPSEKFLRKFYQRPYFLPSVVQMTESNWLFMSSGYRGKKYKMVDTLPAVTVMWVAQLRGYCLIHLEPREPCKDVCNVVEDVILEGDMVVFSPTLWKFSYLPGEDTENLAIAAGGFSVSVM